MRHLAANAISIFIVLGLALAAVIAWGVGQYRAPGPHADAVQVSIPRGATLNRAATLAEEAGVIADARLFRIGARYQGLSERIQAGEFDVPAGASAEEVLRCFVDQSTCDRVSYDVAVIEGMTSWDVVERLNAIPELTGEIAEIPPAGALAPDTYGAQRGDDRNDLIARMTAVQEARLAEAWEGRAEGLPLASPYEALILASIIEKETAIEEERGRVAGVFVNRLLRGMRLQTDPTVIYGVTEGRGSLGRGLRRSELDRRTPWNTYQIDGLPPTPIANPGLASIEAALNPLATNDLFFVADGTGGHVFAETYAEHQRNVAEWRRIERRRQLEREAAEDG